MDPILTTILSAIGNTALKKTVEEAITKLFKGKKPNVTQREKQAIADAAQKMVQAATMDDVKAYSPTYLSITSKIAPRAGGATKKSAAKKAPAKKVAAKRAPAKKVAAKKATAKSAAAKKSAARGRR